jgi:prepilin-type N-terminal cleavage/methylation domain-containing protein
VRLPLDPRLDDGFSLAELLITIVLVSITFVAILTGLTTTIRLSAVHRTQSTTDAVVRSAAEWVKDSAQTPYRATCNGPSMYSLSGLAVPPGYSVTISQVQYWDGAPAASGTYNLSSHMVNACPGGTDQGLQRITIAATSANGQASETVQVMKRAFS